MKKKLLSIFLVLNIICFQVSGAYISAYASAADIVVNGLMSEGAAMSTLMTMFGISPSAAALAAAGGVGLWGVQQVEKYKRYMGAQSEYESEDVANQAAADLVDGVAHGVVDTASKAYSSFKSWLQSLADNKEFPSGMATNSLFVPKGQIVNYDYYNYTNGKARKASCTSDMHVFAYDDEYFHFIVFYGTNPNAKINIDGSESWMDRYYIVGSDGLKYYYTYSFAYIRSYPNYQLNVAIPFIGNFNETSDETGVSHVLKYVLGRPAVAQSDYSIPDSFLDLLGGRDKTLEDLEQQGISSTGAIGTTGTGSRVVDVNNVLGKTGASSMDKVLEKVYNGELSWSDFMDAMGVATTVNTATGTQALTIDKANTATFEKAEEYEADQEFRPPVTDIVVAPSYDDTDFTVKNLEEIFPFCIPFDLYDFINILAAEPQAPHWRLKASFIGRDDLYLDIDLKSWDKVAEYCRDFELLIYIVGLILVTRNLIRG